MSRRMSSDVIRLDAATLGAKIAAKEVSSTEVDPGLPGSDRRDRRPVPRVPARRGGAGAGRGRPGRRGRRRGRAAAVAAGRCAAGAQGRVHHHRHADHVRVEDPRGLDVAVRRHRHRAAARRGHPDPGQDEHGRVRDGLAPPRTRRTARPATRGTSTGCPADRAAAARRRWPRSRRRWPSGRTPAGRSASPPR